MCPEFGDQRMYLQLKSCLAVRLYVLKTWVGGPQKSFSDSDAVNWFLALQWGWGIGSTCLYPRSLAWYRHSYFGSRFWRSLTWFLGQDPTVVDSMWTIPLDPLARSFMVLCIIESRWSVLIIAPGLDGIIQQMQYWNIKVYETAATMLGLPDSSKLSLFAGSELINRNADLSLAPIADGAAWLRQGSTNHQGPFARQSTFLSAMAWPCPFTGDPLSQERNICGIRLIISDDGPNTRNLGHWT